MPENQNCLIAKYYSPDTYKGCNGYDKISNSSCSDEYEFSE